MQFPGNLGERKKARTGRLGNLDSSPNSVQSINRAEAGFFLSKMGMKIQQFHLLHRITVRNKQRTGGLCKH